MPSGMRVAIKRHDEGIELYTFVDDICRKAKIRHPNLVSTLGYCETGDHECLVYEYCVNGDLGSWLLGKLLSLFDGN
jgi:serine/threonine protein kinase